MLEAGGLFEFGAQHERGAVRIEPPATLRPMTMAEKILAAHVVDDGEALR
jgi:hypothetical protein